MWKLRGKSIQAAPHDIENPNPYSNPYMQLAARMTEELQLDEPSLTYPSRCIFRVPHRLRCEHEKAVHYTPQIISIGPLHHENPALKAMEVHKKRYLQYFLGRPNIPPLVHYINIIKDQEARLRSCYSEIIVPESDKFVKIILVDAIFIIEFLFRHWYPELLDEDDCIFGKPVIKNDIWPDLLMLENQLPFFILEDLFDPAIFPVPDKYFKKLKGVERLSILFLSLYFLNDVPFGGRSYDLKEEHFVDLLKKLCIAPMKEQNEGQAKPTTKISSKVEHFVDLLRKLCIAPMKEQNEGQAKPITNFWADVGQERGHMIADELVRVNVHDEVGVDASLGANELEGANLKVRADKSLGATASLGVDELEGDSSEDGLVSKDVGATMLVGAAMPLGADELEGDISEDDLEGITRPLGADELEDDIPLGAAMPLGANELADEILVNVGAAMPLGGSWEDTPEGQSKYITAPSIEELHLAGVEFEGVSTNNLFDIQFIDGILKIPKLKTDDRTELILRNLVAFEQCAFITQKRKKTESAFECYISDYVCIMDQFVDTSKDVELLVQYKIVENILGGGDDALSTMINSVSTGVIYHPTDLAYDTLRIDLNKFCGSGCNKNMANLRQNYFNTPWATISFFAAVILLILTIVQTICSIISLS